MDIWRPSRTFFLENLAMGLAAPVPVAAPVPLPLVWRDGCTCEWGELDLCARVCARVRPMADGGVKRVGGRRRQRLAWLGWGCALD